MVIPIPDTAADLRIRREALELAGVVELVLRSRIEELSRDLALAESRLEQLERQLVAAGVMNPELGP